MPAPAVFAAVAALAALAQAGGSAMSAVSGSREASRKRRTEDAWHKDDLKQQAFENKIAQQRLGIESEAAAQARPSNMLNFISGLEDLKQKRQKSGGYLETVRGLAGR